MAWDKVTHDVHGICELEDCELPSAPDKGRLGECQHAHTVRVEGTITYRLYVFGTGIKDAKVYIDCDSYKIISKEEAGKKRKVISVEPADVEEHEKKHAAQMKEKIMEKLGEIPEQVYECRKKGAKQLENDKTICENKLTDAAKKAIKEGIEAFKQAYKGDVKTYELEARKAMCRAKGM
jgi:hypothetical protein